MENLKNMKKLGLLHTLFLYCAEQCNKQWPTHPRAREKSRAIKKVHANTLQMYVNHGNEGVCEYSNYVN